MRELPQYFDVLRMIAHRDPWNEVVECLLIHQVSGKPRTVAKPLEFVELPDHRTVEPTFRLQGSEAQELMDMLWNCGLRPTQAKSSAGQLEAVERHLADLRAIAFHKLEIERP